MLPFPTSTKHIFVKLSYPWQRSRRIATRYLLQSRSAFCLGVFSYRFRRILIQPRNVRIVQKKAMQFLTPVPWVWLGSVITFSTIGNDANSAGDFGDLADPRGPSFSFSESVRVNGSSRGCHRERERERDTERETERETVSHDVDDTLAC